MKKKKKKNKRTEQTRHGARACARAYGIREKSSQLGIQH